MLVALFSVNEIKPSDQENTLILEGVSEVSEGVITAGMFYSIPLNRSLGMTVPISEVISLCEDRIQLLTYFEDKTLFDIVYSLSAGNEFFEIYDSEGG